MEHNYYRYEVAKNVKSIGKKRVQTIIKIKIMETSKEHKKQNNREQTHYNNRIHKENLRYTNTRRLHI
jgi:hypothetical protein